MIFTSAFPLRAVIAGGNRPPLTEARAKTGGPLAVDEVEALPQNIERC